MSKGHAWRCLAVGGLAACGLIGIGCGDDGADGKSEGAIAGIKSSETTSKRDIAAKAGAEAAQAAGDPVEIGKKKVGVVMVVSSDAVKRAAEAVRQAGGKLGWTTEICDAEGVPAKMASCSTTLLAQRPDLMISVAVEAAAIKPQMQRAKGRKIPWINISGPAAPDPLFSSQVTYDEEKMGRINAEYIVKQLGGEGKVATDTIDQVYAVKVRGENFFEAVKSGGLDVVATHPVDLTDPIKDYQRWATTVFTKHPDLKAINTMGDIEALGLVPALRQKFQNKQFPDRPLATTYFGNLSTLDAIRKGQLDATTEAPLDATGWVAVDQAAEYFARQKPFSEDPTADYKLDFLEPYLVTKENLPTDPKAYVDPPNDFVTFFTTKFEKEFTPAA